jgi:hypothetical protein
MRVAVVLVPNRADIARIGFEEQPRHREYAPPAGPTDRTAGRRFSIMSASFDLEPGFAFRTGEIVSRHRFGSTSTALRGRFALGAAAEERQMVDRHRKTIALGNGAS